MTVTSGDWFIAAWTFGIGLGSGLAFATSASAAIVDLSAERSGVGSALLQSIVKLGPAFGASVLGSVLNSAYQSHVDVTGLPSTVVTTVKSSVFGGLAVAQQLKLPNLLNSVKSAFVSGMDNSLLVTAGIAAGCVILAIIFVPKRIKGK
jgi:hypothetical protein